MRLTRRIVLVALAGTLAPPFAGTAQPAPAEGELELTSLHTHESVRFLFREGAALDDATAARVAHVLRDHRSSEERDIDPALFAQLVRLAAAAAVPARYEVISAYRAPATNAKLRESSQGVSSRSLHMEGRAIDVRLRDVDALRLATLARALGAGGVGYYPGDRFVHIDTGRPRTWDG